MLLTREKKIIGLLIEHEDKLTTKQIADSLNVSSRTIKADIKKINEELEKHYCRINSQQGVGLWIEYNDVDAEKYLRRLITNESDSYLLPEIRKYHFAVELLFQENFISMELLAKEYYVSRATVVNDLAELDQFWSHFNLQFIKKVKYGIKVEGAESQIRSALIEALKKAGGKKKTEAANIQKHFENVDFNMLRKIINQVEGRFQFILTDASVEELVIALAVMIKRVSQGKVMDQSDTFPHTETRRMGFVLQYLKECIVETLGIKIPDEENTYLRICLSGLRFHVPMDKEKNLSDKRERNSEMFDFVIELLMECDRKFSLNMADDNELISALMDHLECMILRNNSNSSSLNDGAAAVVVMSKEKAQELGVTPKLKIEGYAVAGFDAELMGYSPKLSSEKLAAKLGLDLKQIDMFEINEAFASQAYAVSRDLGLDEEKVNIYGGGISIGHPIGATGTMLTVKVMYELMRTDKKDAMISMCIGGGQGISMYFTKCQ